MTGRKNIKKLQISPKYRKGYHIYIQWQSRITRKNWDCQENWDYQRNKQRLARLPRKLGISKTKIETAKFIPTILARNMKVTIQRNDWSKDRHSRRTTRTYNPMQCIFMFCIVLQPYVYLYTQFQNPPAW